MTDIYEAFLWWLTLWLPASTGMGWMLDDASETDRTDEFWEAIAPNQDNDHPCSRPLTEKERDTMESLLWEHYHADPEEFA